MIHAFFNIRLDDAYLPERTGQLVRDAGEARAVARTIIRRLVVQHGGEPRLLNAVMAVTDADGASILDLSFFEALYVPVAAPERAGPARPRADLRRAAGRMPDAVSGKAGAAVAGIAARMRALSTHPRIGAAALRLRAHLAAMADLLSFRRDPRQRFTLQLDPGR
ncbi:catalase [Methylobacterium sp. WL30]|uniref:DUF6894 family protein n=2 Tax=Methylobacterium TaxID=407 RepID=UPI0011C860FF|nr:MULTISPECIES: catalase [unclassified Methylobacterium]TXN51369.1 catalase [Methylobacterium sp. WL119]TXN70085.1 catalase [Methylobacterium sp. WL30]